MLARFIRYWCRGRYRIQVKGLEEIQGLKGHLVLPNHVSLLDPFLVATTLSSLAPRPVVTQTFFDPPQFRFFFHHIKAICAPNFILGTNLEKKYLFEKALQEVIAGLKKGDNIMFYPAGRLKIQEEEIVEGSSGLYRLLEMQKNLEVILVRTTGLWGSMFSTAPHGKTPSFARYFLLGLLCYLSNLWIFTPKRKVEIECKRATLHLKDFADKRQLNQFLESWYNAKKDPFYSPPYHVLFRKQLFKRVFSCPPVQIGRHDLLREVLEVAAQVAGRGVGPKEHLARDVGLDSLQLAEFALLLEEKYGFTDLYTIDLATPEHLVALIEKSWIPNRMRSELEKQRKRAELLFKKKACCLDQLKGPLSLKQIGGQIAAYRAVFEKEPALEIPLLIPGGIDAYSAYMAAKQAGKTPLFLKPEEVSSYPQIYTTSLAIARWNLPPFNHQAGTLVPLPAKISKSKYKIPDAALELPDSKVFINTWFPSDVETFIASTHAALKKKIPILFPFHGVRNMSWSERILESFHEVR